MHTEMVLRAHKKMHPVELGQIQLASTLHESNIKSWAFSIYFDSESDIIL